MDEITIGWNALAESRRSEPKSIVPFSIRGRRIIRDSTKAPDDVMGVVQLNCVRV